MRVPSFFTLFLPILWLLTAAHTAPAQCTWYTITVTNGTGAPDVSWELIDDLGVTWASGTAPWDEDICLPDGCYTLLMFDASGDGWDDIDWFIADWTGDFDFDTNLPNGPHGTDGFVLGVGLPCDPVVIGASCPPGTLTLQLVISAGSQPAQVSWTITLNTVQVYSGGAPFNDTLCLDTGCYVLNLFDSGGNGWQGATYTLQYFGGGSLFTGTLASGSSGTANWSIGGAGCGGGGGGGGGAGGPCGNTGDPTGDCPTAVCACDPYTFPITPSGFGSLNEVPSPGSISNPAFGGISPAPWGGTDYGCLLAGELNSSWILFTIGASGNLAFAFGAGGQQVGYYDWAMWPYTGPATCTAIASNTLPPVRCVWDAVPWGGAGLANTIPAGGDPGNYAPELPVLAGQQYIICMSNWSYVNATVTLDFFGTATIACGTVLPIELLELRAECIDHAFQVSWSTATESNSDHFVVQRSADAINWTDAAVVPAAGWSMNTVHYRVIDAATDAAPDAPAVYYRLLEVDGDGSSTWSPIVAGGACSDRTVLDRWLIDAQGRMVRQWTPAEVDDAPGYYCVLTRYTDGSSTVGKRIVIVD